ncbi:MAG: hypothetical protein N2593_03460 [Patescibacteria group bacterium]|nr:hypothetical protein [Patescibacteria group bacterium]
MKKIVNFLFFLFFFLLFFSTTIFSVNMESSRFKIESANTSIASGEKSSSNYKLSDTIGQIAAGEFSSSGYVVKAGFQYIHSIIPFRFSISNTNINLGTLLPNTPATATTVLTVYFGSAGQYQVTVAESHPLKTLSNNTIPDTNCNGGSETCTESIAKTWNLSSAYGFGYNMSGDDIPSDFNSSSKFRPFPDLSASENPVVIMSSNNVGKNRQATMTFKVNISSIQPIGSYQTVINFIATPSF